MSDKCLQCEVLLHTLGLNHDLAPFVLINWEYVPTCNPDHHPGLDVGFLKDGHNPLDFPLGGIGCYLDLKHIDAFGPQFRVFEQNEQLVVLESNQKSLEVHAPWFSDHADNYANTMRTPSSHFVSPMADPELQVIVRSHLNKRSQAFMLRLFAERYHFDLRGEH